jgi:hypothetical protein
MNSRRPGGSTLPPGRRSRWSRRLGGRPSGQFPTNDSIQAERLSPERLREALEARRARKNTRKYRRRVEAIFAQLAELKKRRDGLIDLALDDPLSKAELSERLVPLDAKVKVLEEEADALREEEHAERGREEDERMMLWRLETGLPEDLDALKPLQRRELYRCLDLTVVANRDKSLTLKWFVDVDLEVIRCQEEET